MLGDEPYQEAYAAVLARWPEGTTTRDVGGPMGTTRVTVCGPADAPPIVLLSGGGATGLVWFALAEHLAAADLTTAFRLYALDLIDDPGGSTLIPRRMAGPDVVVGWLDGVLDRLGLATTTVMGHSYGGWIALRYALDRPARVDRMVLLDPSDCVSRPRPAYVLRALPLILRARRSNVEALLRWETSGELPDAQWRELFIRGATDFPAARIVVPRRPKPEQLAGLAPPTLVLSAMVGRALDAGRLAEGFAAVPAATVQDIPGASHHGMPLRSATEVAGRTSEFLGA